MLLKSRSVRGQLVMLSADEKHMVDCDGCGGHGETEGEHLQNCDVEECETCARNEDCRDCRGEGVVECDGCELCDELSREAA